MVRRITGVVVGLIAGGLGVFLIEGISSFMYPAPPGFDWQDREAVRQFVVALPAGAFLIVLAAHGIGTFLAGFTCAAIVQERWLAGPIIIAALLLLGGISNLLMIPHPIWFATVDVLLYIPAALAGGRIGGIVFGTAAPNAQIAVEPQ